MRRASGGSVCQCTYGAAAPAWGGDNFGERAPVWSPWSSMTQPGPPRPEHLDEEYKSGDVSSQSALITRRPRSPSKLHISHACSLLVITQREDMGEFFFF